MRACGQEECFSTQVTTQNVDARESLAEAGDRFRPRAWAAAQA